jgi:hypothetical protein
MTLRSSVMVKLRPSVIVAVAGVGSADSGPYRDCCACP